MSHISEIAEILAGPAPRHDRIKSDDISPRGEPERTDLVTTRQLDRAAKARKASVSVQGSGGGESAPASSDKGSLRATLYAAAGMDR